MGDETYIFLLNLVQLLLEGVHKLTLRLPETELQDGQRASEK